MTVEDQWEGRLTLGILKITALGVSCVVKQIIRMRKLAGMRKFGKHLTK